MGHLVRFGISMDRELLRKFDAFLREHSYTNRSEAVRDMVRKQFVDEEWETGRPVAGTVLLVYDHHRRDLVNRILDVQHDFHDIIISTQHVHFDQDTCFEIIVLKGDAGKLRRLYNALRSFRGVKYASVSRATLGRDI